MAKVKCKVCESEKDSFCLVKKCKIRPNKSRSCDQFEFAEYKIKIHKMPPITRIPMAEVIKEKDKFKKAKKVANRIASQPRIKDTSHPLTGDLSRFTTTAKTGDR